MKYRIKRVFIEASIKDHPYTKQILEKFDRVNYQILPSGEKPPIPLAPLPDVISWGKETLFLTKFQGRFFRPCPGTKNYICCGYKIFHIGQGCPLNCTYCILQAYFNQPWLSFFINVLEDGLRELIEVFKSLPPGRVLRIGTGEFTDSVALDPFTQLNRKLVEFFATQERAVLELKTKATYIEPLKDLDHRRKTIVSWSLNTERIAGSEEINAPSVGERLRTAKTVSSWGYPVGFHFDPIIYYPGCEKEYIEIVDQIFDMVPADNIVWISLGTLRYMPSLKEIALLRFPKTKIYSEEFIIGLDGKKRYFRSLRVELYQALYRAIRKHSKEVCVYLCMESPEVWKESFGFSPLTQGGLPKMLDKAAIKVCKLKEK